MKKKSINAGGSVISYSKSGSGTPVMLVHGFGEDASVWKNQVPALEPAASLIIPDLPGSGESEMTADMSMKGMAAILHAIMQEEGWTSCRMIGHSMGGYITLAFAETHPRLLDGFGLFHSTAFADSEEKIENRKKGIRFIREQGAFEFLKTTTPNLYAPETRDKRAGIISGHIAGLSNFSADALVQYYEAMIARPDRSNVLKNSKVPVLFIAGRYDNAVPLSDVMQQCHLPDLSYIHIFEKSGHMGMLEEEDKANQALLEFIAG